MLRKTASRTILTVLLVGVLPVLRPALGYVSLTIEAATAPSPCIVYVNYPSQTIKGEYAVISIAGKNTGGDSPEGDLCISFPDNPSNIEIISSDATHMVTKRKGDKIWGGYGQYQLTAQYPLVVAYETPWPNSLQRYLSVKVTLQAAGAFTFYVKLTIQNNYGKNWFGDPSTSSYIDQQNEYTYKYTIDVIDDSISAQERKNTITFSTTKTLQKSESFALLGSSLTISASADFSLTMPADVVTRSNATTAKNGTEAWIMIYLAGESATIRITVTVSASIGDRSQSVTKTWTKTFTTPIGSSEITFDTFSIPALDVVIGRVTVDLTPKAILSGQATGKINVNGPARANIETLNWVTQGSKKIIFVWFDENKDIEINLSSMSLTMTQLTLALKVGTTVSSVIGTKRYDLGTLQLPISTTIPVSSSPESVLIAHFSTSSPPFGLPPVSLVWVFVAITIIAISSAVAIAIKEKRRQHTLNNKNPQTIS